MARAPAAPVFAPMISKILTLLAASTMIQGSASKPAVVGVDYGTMADNLPPPTQVAHFLLQSTTLRNVRLFDANPEILKAFAHTGIAVTITVPNGQIPLLNQPGYAQKWVRNGVLLHIPATNIIRILVGNEVLSTANKLLIANLVPAMQALHAALAVESLDRRIQVSTPHSLGILSTSSPPSTGKFRQGYDTHILKPMLDFLRVTNSPFMVNPYPFFGCSATTLDYALFRRNPGVVDRTTGAIYTNMLDAQLDAVFSAMKLLGFPDVDIVIAETGWPSAGDPGQVAADAGSAAEYNRKLIEHVSSGVGTPLMPNRTFETYIFGLFNENLKQGPTMERNFGLFRPDFTAVYDAGILRPTANASHPTHSIGGGDKGRQWCVPKSGARNQDLQRNIDYVCGQGLDCRAIQKGGTCFEPDTVRGHAAYAMNAYYQATGRKDYDCDFKGTGAITNVDPSYGRCIY